MNRLLFNANNQVDVPTLILESKGGTVYGSIDGVTGLKYTRSLVNPNEISFLAAKYINGKINPLWNDISDLKTIYIPEYKEKFQIKVTYSDEETETKSVVGTSLAEAELSQILLRNFECNTDDDLELNDYHITKFYDENNTNYSLLNRVLHDKASHFKIAHVDDTLKNLSYEYSANEKSIYDFLVGDVAEQMQCLFVFDSVERTISVYDLCSICNNEECHEDTIQKQYDENGNVIRKPYRDDFHDECPKCHSTNITTGYGSDTTILIDRENLANSIVTETDVDSLKNCLYVEGGDEDINAAFSMLNPCGGQYIYYFSPEVLAEMPEEFRTAYEAYTEKYDYYYTKNEIDSKSTTHIYSPELDKMLEQTPDRNKPDSNYVSKFNTVIRNISSLSTDENYSDYKKYESDTSFIGQASLVIACHNSIDAETFIQSAMMPTSTMETYNKYHALSLLTQKNIGTVAVSGFSDGTVQTVVENAILQSAKTIINTALFSVDIKTTSYDSNAGKWKGTFSITDLQETDSQTCTITNENYLSIAKQEHYDVTENISPIVNIDINGDMETYCKNRINYIISKSKLPTEKGLYELDKNILPDTEFDEKIKLYSIDNLQIINNVMQSCIDVLSDKSLNGTNDNNVSDTLHKYYTDYQNKQAKINKQISILSGYLFDIKMYRLLISVYISEVQKVLNFKNFLENYSSDANLWDIFNYYRRESTYKNENIISTGLETNTDVVTYAGHLMEFAKKEAIKAGTPQITVTNSLNNLLAIPEFQPIIEDFEVGNWIKIRTNIDDTSEEDTIYNLRLLSYTIHFDDLQSIDVEFSTATSTWSGIRDVNDVIESAQNMATSFNYISKQVEQTAAAASIVDTWVNDSLDLTNQKITSQANDQSIVIDEHGILARKYDELSDTYDDCQIKIFNNGLYTTHNNWESLDAAVGKFIWRNPDNNWEEEETYGIIAKKLVGEQILGKDVQITNEAGTMRFDENGFSINSKWNNGTKNRFTINPNNNQKMVKITKELTEENGNIKSDDVFYTDNNGNLHMVGIMDINGGYFRGDITAEGTITGGKIIGAGIEGGNLNVGSGKLVVDDTQCSINGDITANTLTIKDKISVSGIGDILDCNKNALLRTYLNLGMLHKTYVEMTDDGTLGTNGYGGTISLCSSSVKIPGSLTVDQDITGNLYGCAKTLANAGDTNHPMTFHWNGQSGQPTWVWGGEDGTNMYVYNPSNFSVSYANTAGSANTSKCVYTNIASSKTSDDERYYVVLTNKGNFRPNILAPDNYENEPILVRGLNGVCNLGTDSYRWNTLYASSCTCCTSDRNLKNNIRPLTDKHLQFFTLLQPVSFTFKEGTSGRTHVGFISQDVEEAMKQVGLTSLDFAGFCKNVKMKCYLDNDGNETEEPILDENGNEQYIYSLRYEEFIAINTYAIQHLMTDLNQTKDELSNLKATVNKLMNFVNYKEDTN